MADVKQIIVKVIPSNIANEFVKKHHYSWKVVANSQLHFGCFLNGILGGVLSYWPSTDKSKLIWLVEWTQRNEFIELNRMAFSDILPRNSESRCIAISIRLIKKNAPHIKRIVSFADWCQCWDWTIYRASWFELSWIKQNKTIIEMPDGSTIAWLNLDLQLATVKAKYDEMCWLDPKWHYTRNDYIRWWAKRLQWYMLRYIKLLKPNLKRNYSIIPYSEIDKYWAWMYKWEKITREKRHKKADE